MEGRKNDMYSRAAKIREGGWTQIEVVIPGAPQPEVEMAEVVPQEAVMPEPVPMPMPVPEPMPRPMPVPMPIPMPMQAAAPDGDECNTLAMAYIPMQKWAHTYEAEMGFARGTIFPELDLPFLGGVCNHE